MLFLLILPSADFRASYSQGDKNLPKTSAGFSEMQKKSRRQIAMLGKFPALCRAVPPAMSRAQSPVPGFRGPHKSFPPVMDVANHHSVAL